MEKAPLVGALSKESSQTHSRTYAAYPIETEDSVKSGYSETSSVRSLAMESDRWKRRRMCEGKEGVWRWGLNS